MKPKIYVGTSGFSYADWVGRYYPEGTKPSQMFEYYAAEFNCVEINSTHYGYLSPRTANSLVSRAPDEFRFSVKLHKDFTHVRHHLKNAVSKTNAQNRPFEAEGKLGVLLAQFPFSFHYSDANFRFVKLLTEHFEKLCIEFRCESWNFQEVHNELRSHGTATCVVDQPRLKGLSGWNPMRTSDTAYGRFHGRNSASWYEHEEAWERYDYEYKESELKPLVPGIQSLAEDAREAYLFFNNHYQAQAITNARQMAALIGAPMPKLQRDLLGEN